MAAALKRSQVRALSNGRLEKLLLPCSQSSLANYASFVSTAPGLKEITIELDRWTKPTDATMGHLTQILSNPSIDSFTLRNTEMNEAQMAQLMKAVNRKTSLKSLKLDNCRVTDDGAAIIATTLKKHPALRQCQIAENTLFIHERGTEALAEVPAVNRNLTALHFKAPYKNLAINQIVTRASKRWTNPNLSAFSPAVVTTDQYTQQNVRAAHITLRHCAAELEQGEADAITPADRVKLCYMMPLIEMLASDVLQQTDTLVKIKQIANRTHAELPWVNPQLPCSEKDLLDGSQPSSLLQGFAESRQLGTLFSLERWEGKPVSAMTRVFRSMPQDWRDQVPNYHQLTAALSRTHKQEGRER